MSTPQDDGSDLLAYTVTCGVVLSLIVLLQVLLHG